MKVDPTSIERCPDCHSRADVCLVCRICIRCAPDGHDEGCPNEGDEYTAEQIREINEIVSRHTTTDHVAFREIP